MAVPESIDRHVTEALLTVAQGWSYADAVLLFEGNPFDAVARAEINRSDAETVILIGQTREDGGIRAANRNRGTSSLRYAVLTMAAFGDGRTGYEDSIKALTDLAYAVITGLEGALTDLKAELTSAEAAKVSNIEVGEVNVLADPDANWGARDITTDISLIRT